MERTRTPVGAAGWLWVTLAVAAMGFSLVHTLVDFALIALESRFGVQQSLLSVLIGLLYTWWAWVFAKAVGGTKSWLVGLHGVSQPRARAPRVRWEPPQAPPQVRQRERRAPRALRLAQAPQARPP